MIEYIEEPILNYRFSKSDLNIRKVDFTSDVSRKLILNDYFIKGFAIYELDKESISEENTIGEIATYLNLGKPYTPGIYINSNIYKDGINKLSVSKGNHRAFQTNNAQGLHCDGTIERIGLIKTSIIHCVKAAKQGGENIIFNSVGVFHDLYKNHENRKTLEVLFEDDALKRLAVNVANQEYIGPVFKIINDKLISRFSNDNTCSWKESFDKDSRFEEAFNAINNYAVENSPFFIEFKLADNQGIVLANDRIAHGRRAFVGKDRIFIRGLYKESLQ